MVGFVGGGVVGNLDAEHYSEVALRDEIHPFTSQNHFTNRWYENKGVVLKNN
jgi:hypothetical protein